MVMSISIHRRVLVRMAVPIALFTIGPVAASTQAPAAAAGGDATPVPRAVAVPLAHAKTAFANAQHHVASHEFARATKSLRNTRRWLAAAHNAAMAEIGAPPTDPESDEPPGPVSVIAVLGLEHRVVVRGTAMFDGLSHPIRLNRTVRAAMARRDLMLDKIIALPPEGAGSDYSDGMSDTVPSYAKEVTAITTVLQTASLTRLHRQAIQAILAAAKATQATVDAAYGGGE